MPRNCRQGECDAAGFRTAQQRHGPETGRIGTYLQVNYPVALRQTFIPSPSSLSSLFETERRRTHGGIRRRRNYTCPPHYALPAGTFSGTLAFWVSSDTTTSVMKLSGMEMIAGLSMPKGAVFGSSP